MGLAIHHDRRLERRPSWRPPEHLQYRLQGDSRQRSVQMNDPPDIAA